MSLTLKQLLDIAKFHLFELAAPENPDFRLEQAEYNKIEGTWEIIVSYLVNNSNKRSGLAAVLNEFNYFRIYKKLKINDIGEVIGFYLYNNKE